MLLLNKYHSRQLFNRWSEFRDLAIRLENDDISLSKDDVNVEV